jgi:hypothetical protein
MTYVKLKLWETTYGYLYMVSGVWPKNNLRSLCRENLRLEQVLIPKVGEHVVRIKRSILTGTGRYPSRILVVTPTVLCHILHCLPHVVQKYAERVPYIRPERFFPPIFSNFIFTYLQCRFLHNFQI